VRKETRAASTVSIVTSLSSANAARQPSSPADRTAGEPRE